jgi:hypothetical protein
VRRAAVEIRSGFACQGKIDLLPIASGVWAEGRFLRDDPDDVVTWVARLTAELHNALNN